VEASEKSENEGGGRPNEASLGLMLTNMESVVERSVENALSKEQSAVMPVLGVL